MAHPGFRSPTRASTRGGLSRVEVLIAAGILLIFAGIGFIPISNYLETARINRAVESARTIDTILSQYANDNNGVYPVGEGTPAAGKSEGIALNLLQNNYLPDATVFAVGSTTPYAGKASDFADLAAANLSWDFTAGANATTGITAAVSDYLPVVYSTGETVDYASAKGHGLVLTPSGKGPFARKGVIVAYKGGSAVFIPAESNANEVPTAFIMPNFNDPGPFTQIRP